MDQVPSVPRLPIRVRPDVVFRTLGDGAVLVNLADNRIFELNETATAIWTRLLRGETVEGVSTALTDTFAIDREAARAAVTTLVSDLTDAGVIEP